MLYVLASHPGGAVILLAGYFMRQKRERVLSGVLLCATVPEYRLDIV